MTQLIKHLPPHQAWEDELIISASPATVGMHVTVSGLRGTIQRLFSIRGSTQPHFDVSTSEEGLLVDVPLSAFE